MKKISQSILAFIALVGMTNLMAYEYDLSNNTEYNMVVRLRPWGVSKDYYQIIPSGGSVKQVWQGLDAGGACIGSLEWAEWKGTDAEYKKWASDRGRIPNEKQRAFGDQWKTAMNRMEMILEPNEAYDLIVANSKSLATGIDTILCKAVEQAEKAGAYTNILSKANPNAAVDRISQLARQGATNVINTTAEKTKEAIVPTKIDLEGSVINTSMASGSTQQSKCSFGIGEITEAAAKIAGNTNCKSRTYDICYKMDPKTDEPMVDKSKFPVRKKLIAITRAGE